VDGKLVEIKGLKEPVDDIKLACVPEKVYLLDRAGLREVFDFVTHTYGCKVEYLWDRVAKVT